MAALPTNVVAPVNEVAPLTVSDDNVPTLVRLDAVTPEARVAPVSVPAAAVTVMSAEPLNATPLIFREVAKVVAVEALPEIVVCAG